LIAAEIKKRLSAYTVVDDRERRKSSVSMDFVIPVYLLYCIVGWVDIGTGTKVPLRFVTYCTFQK
jgi:hypothetical protein